VCVRLYYTLQGASEPFAKLGLGNPVGPRNNVDLAFLTPDGRNIDVRTLQPIEGPSKEGAWVRDVVSTAKNEAGDGKEIVEKAVELMKELVRIHPAKRAVETTPWQVSLSHAIFVSAWDGKMARNGGPRDARRLVIVPAPGGAVEPSLEKALEAAELLKRFERHYVFAKVDPKDAPAELREALERAGSGGVVVLDEARSVDGFGQKQERAARTYPKAIATRAGPLTEAALVEFLSRHRASREAAPTGR
jgi:hypothetical protein